MLDDRTRCRAAELDRHRLGGAGGDVVAPDAEVALEGERASIVSNRRPEYTPVGELRQLMRTAARGRTRPEVRCAASVAHEVERLAIGRPHRPLALRSRSRHLLVLRRATRSGK